MEGSCDPWLSHDLCCRGNMEERLELLPGSRDDGVGVGSWVSHDRRGRTERSRDL